MAQVESNILAKTQSASVDRLAKATKDDGVDDLKNEVIRSAAKLK